MKKGIVGIVGGLLTIVSVFLPMVNVSELSISMFETTKGVAVFFIICGVTVIGVSLLSKRWLNLLSMFIGLIVCLLALKYYGDAESMHAVVGIGVWLMLSGGLLTIVGSIIGMIGKAEAKPAA